MSRKLQVVCDECGAVKKEANHWWKLAFWRAGQNVDSSHKTLVPVMELAPWLPQPACDPPFAPALEIDICSEKCVHAAVSKYLRGELKPAPESAVVLDCEVKP